MRLEELKRELRAERPEVDPDFARRIDDWAARGFPPGGELDPRRSRRARRALPLPQDLGHPWERLRAIPPRRLLAPAGAAATLVIVLAVAIATQIDSGLDRAGRDDVEAPALTAPPAQEGTIPDDPRAAGGEGVIQGLDSGRPRRVAQASALSLATAPEDLRSAADGVLDVVRDHNGFVLRSSVSGGDPGVEGAELGRASFRLRIPAPRLQAALGALSDLGHLVSRTDGTRDITSRFTSAQRRIETFTQSRDRLLRRLEDAVTEAERQSIRARLRIVESRLERAESDLARARQRVRRVPVNVTITADRSIQEGGGWGIGDALEDARRVLTVAAGVILVGAAVLLPLAVLVALGWLVAARARRFQRNRALDA